MTTASKKAYKAFKKKGKVRKKRLSLAKQITDSNGNFKGVKSTGPHTVVYKGDKKVEFYSRSRKEDVTGIEFTFEENGEKKTYRKPVTSKDGSKLHYFVEAMAPIDPGATVRLEYIKNGKQGYIDVKRLDEDEDVETIDNDDVSEEQEKTVKNEVTDEEMKEALGEDAERQRELAGADQVENDYDEEEIPF